MPNLINKAIEEFDEGVGAELDDIEELANQIIKSTKG